MKPKPVIWTCEKCKAKGTDKEISLRLQFPQGSAKTVRHRGCGGKVTPAMS